MIPSCPAGFSGVKKAVMRCFVCGPDHNPALNLAREEYLFTRLAAIGDVLLFYVNTDAVVIGRNQVPWAEVPASMLAKAGLPLVRRVSGGGAVYHDPGNLNYSILLQATAAGRPKAATILLPVVRAIQSLGLPARLANRNAIFVGRHKVSGTSQYMTAGKIMTHGTLLIDTDLARLNDYLRPDSACRVHSRGRPSVHSAVANLRALRPEITMAGMRGALQHAFAAAYGPLAEGTLTPVDEQAAQRLAVTKYRTWEWNIGRTPPCTLEWEGDFQGAICRCRLHVQRGVITAVEVAAPLSERAELQRWAEDWLPGRRLGDPLAAAGATVPAISGEGPLEFRRWLQAHLPAPLHVPRVAA